MNWGLIIFVAGLIFFLILIPAVVLHAQLLKQSYGPKELGTGPSIAEGQLVCKSWKAPTLGKQLQFAYDLWFVANGNQFTGECRYPPPQAAQHKVIYRWPIFFSVRKNTVNGRTKRKVFDGGLRKNGSNLMIGFPKASLLHFLNSPFQFRIVDEQVDFLNTNSGQAIIGPGSRLHVTSNTVSGQLVHSRESWRIEVDITYAQVPPAIMVSAVLLLGNDILDFHHDN